MALERAREYELRQRQFELTAARFYNVARILLAANGRKFVDISSGYYPMPVVEDGQGGGTEFQQYTRELPYVIFGTEVSGGNGEISTVVLSSIAVNKREFKQRRPRIFPSMLYGTCLEFIPKFDLRIAQGKFSVEEIMHGRKPVLEFDIGNTDPNENRISVYGKDFLVDTQFNVSVPSEAFNEFDELVELAERLFADPDSYKKIYPKPKSAKLDKAHA